MSLYVCICFCAVPAGSARVTAGVDLVVCGSVCVCVLCVVVVVVVVCGFVVV